MHDILPPLPIVRPMFPPLASISERFSAALKSGQVTNDGKHVREFEAALMDYLGVPTICFSSGMAALVAMLMVQGVDGYEVICPSFTFCATPHAIRLAGGKVVFADIDPRTLTLDPADVWRKTTSRTKAILAVDVYGICCDYTELARVANHYEVDLLLDSAPAFGSLWHGRATACPMDAPQIFSFHATKPFCVGEGGALCSISAPFRDHARKIRNFGLPPPPVTLWPTIGFNGKMQEINALIGLEQLKGFAQKRATRTAAAAFLAGALDNIEGVTTIRPPDDQVPVWCYFPILINESEFGMSRDRVVEGLKRRGIETRTYYPAMHLSDVYRHARTSLPATERVARQVIALPVYSDMTSTECDRIAMALRDIRGGRLDE